MIKLLKTFLFTCCIIISSCSKTQDEVNLPILDAVGGDFILPGTTQQSVSLADYRGAVVLVNFGYTSCPDVCPMILSSLSELTKNIYNEGYNKQQLQIIFISVDPERDNIKHLKQYLNFFHPDFAGVSASLEQTRKVTKKYAVFFEKLEADENGYQVAHTDKIFLMDKRGRLRGLYTNSVDDEKLFNDIIKLIEADY